MILWAFNDNPIRENQGLSLLNSKRSSQINIENVNFEHVGSYTCIANNSAGFVTYSAELNVNGKRLLQLELFFYVLFCL